MVKVSELIGKALSGAELTAEEKDFLTRYQEPEMKDRIPKSRLDQEIARRRELEEKAAALQQQMEELAGRDLSEQEKTVRQLDAMKRQLTQLQQERDDAVAARSEMEFRSRVGELSGRHGFTDTEYLGFLARKQNVDLLDDVAADGFIDQLRQSSPKFFRVATNGGAGSGNSRETGIDLFAAAAASGDIEAMIAAAPRLAGDK